MKKILLVFVMGCLLSVGVCAQDAKQGTEPIKQTIEKTPLHQLYLPKQAIKVGVVRYKDGEVLDGELSPDGMRLILKNYSRKGSVEVTLLFKDGTEETIQRTSCVIDMLPDL